MASVLMISEGGDGVPIALRLANEGHIVKMHFTSDKVKGTLDGFKNPSKIKNPKTMLEQYDLVISDMVGNGSMMDEMSEAGKLILGGGALQDKLELDRTYGTKVVQTLMKDIKLPATSECTKPNELIDTILKSNKRLVVKPNNNKATSLTFVSDDPKNRTLYSWAFTHMDDILPCIVQEVVEGVEISTEGWFDGKDWCGMFNHTIEKKRLMDGDRGPNTGCMGNIVWVTDEDRLVQSTLKALTPLLKKVKYVGPLDVNTIVGGDQAYFLEFTTRFGYDAIQALTELLKGSLFDMLYGIASRTREPSYYTNSISMAVRLSLPPYPTTKQAEQWSGVQVLNVASEARRHVWLADVMKKGELDVLAGVDGVIGCVTARGESVREARRRVYRTITNITLSNDIQYRSDIDSDFDNKRSTLVTNGWLNG